MRYMGSSLSLIVAAFQRSAGAKAIHLENDGNGPTTAQARHWSESNHGWQGEIWSMPGDLTMCRGSIYLILFMTLALGPAGEQACGQYRAAYYDERYRTSWATMPVPELVRDAFEDVGYEVLNADQLKTWMDARIADVASSVVVFCGDVAPDTVVESNSSDCTVRKYLDTGGKVVFYGDIPFWDVGHSDGTWDNHEESGCANILGITGVDWTNDTGTQVTITAEGTAWGLTETWTSNRWTPAGRTTTVLATDASGNAAAWVKHFVPGDTVGGFVRIWDCFVFEWNLPNVEDLIRVAEYGMAGNPYARCPKPADGAVHALTWARMSWYPGDFAVSHDVLAPAAFLPCCGEHQFAEDSGVLFRYRRGTNLSIGLFQQ